MKTDLRLYGFMGETEPESGLLPAVVLSQQKDLYRVICENGETSARVSGKLRFAAERPEDFPTVGDHLLIDYQRDGESRIEKLLPRRSAFQRLDPSSSGHAAQTAAANFDYVFVMQSLNQDFNPRRLERYLTLGWQSGGTPVVLLTKLDLCGDPELMIAQACALAAGVDVLTVSAVTGEGLEEVRALLAPGKTAVFLGSSGVGKSSLVNALMGSEVMDTGGIRQDDDKGRHTTTYRQLLLLPTGGCVIDTPGMRELGMWDVRGGLEESFAASPTAPTATNRAAPSGRQSGTASFPAPAGTATASCKRRQSTPMTRRRFFATASKNTSPSPNTSAPSKRAAKSNTDQRGAFSIC